MEPLRLIERAMCTDDHRGGQVGRFEDPSPESDQPAVTAEDYGLGGTRRDIRRDLPSTVVVERLGDELAVIGRHWRGLLVGSAGHPYATHQSRLSSLPVAH